jgi:Zn-dependent peptidase ImmA (M78 family)/transcriptional regulator with XRE-family HTH domain
MSEKHMDWSDFGQRIANARRAARLSQAELAAALGLDRTAVTKLETGERKVDSLELVRLARALGRPMDWFFAEPIPSVVARRSQRAADGDSSDDTSVDRLLEALAGDVGLLTEVGTLAFAATKLPKFRVDGVESAERAASALRKHLEVQRGPVWDLVDVVERAGLLAFVIGFGEDRLDGSYLRVEAGGVALVNGQQPSARRRFTLAHELGHHVFRDDFSPEWIVGTGSDDRERLINAFAAHFLLPRAELTDRWKSGPSLEEDRSAAIAIGAEYGVSWTALLAQLANLGLIDATRYRALEADRPRKHDYLELGVVVREDAAAPALPRGYVRAVLRAYKSNKISATRAVDMLRGTVGYEDLPPLADVPPGAMRSAFEME